MITETFSWQTNDHLTLHAQEWAPDADPQACVVLVHGLGEHVGRYQHVGEYLAQAGYALCGFDLRGHGHSQGLRCHAPSYDALAGDIQGFVEEIQKRHPGKPVFLYGHSLGGSLVLYTLFTRRLPLAGAIVTSPGLQPAKAVPPAKRALAKLLSSLWPTLTLSNDLDVDGISRDRVVVEAYRHDPLVHDRISSRLGMELLQQGEWMGHQTIELSIPLLLMQGSADRLVNAQATQRLAGQLKGNITWKLWDGYYHELHNAPEKQEMLDFVLNWLRQHQPASGFTRLDPTRPGG
ncbi:MAG: alpha/beta hydrolase [Chloroflexi bacterium]|nr:alpha/beta hydrolase [Chloroflexota bacterium]